MTKHLMILKPGDVCIQTDNNGIWWLSEKDGKEQHTRRVPALIGICIKGNYDYEVGETSPFATHNLDSGVVRVAQGMDHDAALAAAQLGAFL